MIDTIYALAEPYWHVRSGEIHVPASFALAQRLLDALPEADPLIVLPAILLHDVGYARVPEETHHAGLQDAPGGWDADITRRHEIEGARLAREILARVGMDAERRARIVEIVDGHDSRLEALSLEDAIVKDADKLWRYTESGVRVTHVWVGRTPEAFMDYVEAKIDVWLFTAPARVLARESLDAARACAY
ncbi:HD domain-containing protein [Solirubrobacter soli]|uniref:HD domain-containing protein n=1 Tax=Solirubrobacter soli TaxID=363832 RepID=UPI00042388B7|nr:HD domain-containing protein [Solirubrobacter soli]